MSFAIRYNPQKTIEVLTLETENVDQGTIKKKFKKLKILAKTRKILALKMSQKDF